MVTMTTQRERATADAAARFDAEEKREAARFAAATKINADDYDGPVFCDDGPDSRSMTCDGDGNLHASVQDLLEACADDGVEPPPYAYACNAVVPSSDVRWIIESALEEHHDGAGDSITKEHTEKLAAFMREWWAESGAVSYYADRSRVVMLSKKPAT